MKTLLISLLTLASLAGPRALALDARVTTGLYRAYFYSEGDRPPYTPNEYDYSPFTYLRDENPTLRAARKDLLLVVADPKTGVRFRLDLAAGGEQTVSPEGLALIKKGLPPVVGRMLERVTVSEITRRSDGGWQANVNGYLAHALREGALRMKIVIPGVLFVHDIRFMRRDANGYDNGERDTYALFGELSSELRVTSVQSPVAGTGPVLTKLFGYFIKLLYGGNLARGVALVPVKGE